MTGCPNDDELRRFVNESVPTIDEGDFERHLEGCPACRARIESMAGVTAIAGMSSALPLRADSAALDRVMEHLRTERSCPGGDSRTLWATRESPAPMTLGGIAIRRVVGRGGMGIVYDGFDTVLHRRVAVKVLAEHLADDERAKERFLREARAAAALTHEHVVAIHAIDQADGVPFLVLHYVDGESLAERFIREPRLPVDEIVRIGRQVALGLAAAHDRGLVHRDIKPGNILIERGTGQVRISDFGLVKVMGDASVTARGMIAGTPTHMSPEQACDGDVDARSDLFSLGVVLYQAATGELPFRGDNPYIVLDKIRAAEHVPVGERNPALPAWLADVIEQLLHKDPARRIPSAADVAERLAGPSAAPIRRPERRIRRAIVMAAAVFGIAAAGLIIAQQWPPSREDPAKPGRDVVPITSRFEIVGRPEPYATLAEAVQAAVDGDTIEVHGDGPFPSPPMRIDVKNLTIRAAANSRPVFTPPAVGPGVQNFLDIRGNVRLEGIEVRWLVDHGKPLDPSILQFHDTLRRSAIASNSGKLTLVHCRIVAGHSSAGIGSLGDDLSLINCEVSTIMGGGVSWRPSTGRLRIQNSIIESRNNLLFFIPLPDASAAIELTGNTFRGVRGMDFVVDFGLPPVPNVVCRRNVFDVEYFMTFRSRQPNLKKDASTLDMQGIMKSRIRWSESSNAYRNGINYLSAGMGIGPKQFVAPIAGVSEWLKIWNLPPSTSVEAKIRYADKENDPRPTIKAVDPSPRESPGADPATTGPGAPYHAARGKAAFPR